VSGYQTLSVYENFAFEEDKLSKPAKDVLNAGTSPYYVNKSLDKNTSNLSTKSFVSPTDSLEINTSSKSDSQKSVNKLMSTVRGFLVVLALSIHSLFEGMAVGLEETRSGVWQLFLAIAIHSSAIVFCIGTEMIAGGLSRARITLSMLVLSIVTPMGVILGLALTMHNQTETGPHVLVVGILQGIAGGTLLYITFFEVLSREKLSKYGMSGLLGALVIMVGFTLMASLNGISGGHSHGGFDHLKEMDQKHSHEHMEHEDFFHGGHSSFQNRKATQAKDQHHDHDHDRHSDTPYPYDHFHEEYDLDHGDHVHHIGPHEYHSGEDFHSDYEELHDHDHEEKSAKNNEGRRGTYQKNITMI